MKIQAFQFSPFAENTFLLFDETGEAVLIDPGCYYEEEKKRLSEFISKNNLSLKKVIYTHCHLDHAFGANYISNTYPGIPFLAHRAESIFIDSALSHARSFGMTMEQPPALTAYLDEGETIGFGNTLLEIICVPGHSPGGLCFYNKESGDLFSGDVLFMGSVGRSDLPGGSYSQLIDGIKRKLLILPDDVVIYPGHGEYTTIGNEKALNQFLK